MLFAEVGVPLTPMFAHILARAVDGTDFRPSINGGATMPVAAHRMGECRRGMAHRRRRFALPRFGAHPHFTLAPVACTHECNSHLSTFMRSEAVRDSSSRRTVFMDSLRGLPVNVEHVPHACAHTHPIGHVHLVQRISTLGIEGRGDRCSGDSGHGATNERRRHLTAIRELAR